MTNVQQKYARITVGLGFEVLDAFKKKDDHFHKELKRICEEVGAKSGAYLGQGWALLGLKPAGGFPDGWRASKTNPGMMIPNKKTKKGQWWAAQLDKFRIPQTEDLAHDLGFPPFFRTIGGGHFCTNMNYMLYGGVFYVVYPSCLPFPHPHEAITQEEFEKLDNERIKASKT